MGTIVQQHVLRGGYDEPNTSSGMQVAIVLASVEIRRPHQLPDRQLIKIQKIVA
jgi:hypothetical protein